MIGSALCAAIDNQRLDLVRVLIEQGADVNGLVQIRNENTSEYGITISSVHYVTTSYMLRGGGDLHAGIARFFSSQAPIRI